MKSAAKTAAVLCLFAMPVAAKDGANVEIRATVEGVCNPPETNITEVTFDPLLLQAMVSTNCNGTHTVSVTYSLDDPSDPETLVMTFGGQPPSSTAPGSVTFSNLPMTDEPKLLVIQYAGNESDREDLRDTVEIQVSP